MNASEELEQSRRENDAEIRYQNLDSHGDYYTEADYVAYENRLRKINRDCE